MASDRNLYWLAVVVLALGVGARHGKSDRDWVAGAIARTVSLVDRTTDRANSRAEGVVLRLSDRQECVNARVQAAVDRAQAQARVDREQVHSEARIARVNAVVSRINSKVANIDIENDFSFDDK
jgi:hypothetical protein